MAEKKADVWMPLWIGSYLADTMKLTTIQHGAYLLLLIAYWRERAPLVDDDDELRSITKMDRAEWKKHKPVLSRFFRVEDGKWWHKRVEHEIAAAEARSKKASEKAGKAAQARWGNGDKHSSGNAPSMHQALHEDMHDECPPPSHTPLPTVASVPDGTGAAAASAPPASPPPENSPDQERRELYLAGKSLLHLRGMPKAQCGAFISKLVTDYDQDTVLKAVRAAVASQPMEAVEYLKATCQRLKGERKDPVTVASAAAAQTAAYLAEQERHRREAREQAASRRSQRTEEVT